MAITLPLLHRITVTEYRAGTSHKWKACISASVIVGTYERGATLSLAHDLAISVSQVENLARAGYTWRCLRHYGVTSAIRGRLTPTHFCTMGDLLRKYEFSPMEAVEILKECADHGASVETMRGYVEGRYDHKDPEWVRRLGRVVKEMDRLSTDYGVPELVRQACKLFLNLVIIEGELSNVETNHHPGGGAPLKLE